MQIKRQPTGGLIDRNQPVKFSFNGKLLEGYAGDTLASALLANGVDLVGRSFKFHRPRGIVGSGSEEPNAIVQVGTGAHTEPNLRATQVVLEDGMVVRTHKGWPSLEFDVQEILGLAKGVLGAGFYYKTFMGPTRRAWQMFEPPIRRMAAMGVSPREVDPDHYAHRHVHCDVLVAGAGPAGLMAAEAAAQAGARVIIADEHAHFGGRLRASRELIDGKPAHEWVAEKQAELANYPEVTCLPRSTVIAYHDYNFLTINEHCSRLDATQPRQRLWKVRAKQVVLAQGAFERPLVFCNNDRPGIMQCSAVSEYLHVYGVRCGAPAIIFTNNDSAYDTALDLHHAGIEIAMLVDTRQQGGGERADLLQAAGVKIRTGAAVIDTKGRKRIKSALLATLQNDGSVDKQNAEWVDCDLLAVSGGWSPAVHLHSHSGGRNRWDESLLGFVPDQTTQACYSAGAGNGSFELSEVLAEGYEAGSNAAGNAGFESSSTVRIPEVRRYNEQPIEAMWRVPSLHDADKGPKQFVDFQNDVGVSDIRLAVREGFRNVEHVKRYTALGFGTDQGKLGNINGMAILADCLGAEIPEVGTTTFRPNYTPVTFGAIAGEDVGDLYDPVRKTALHAWHEAAGAKFEVVGQWHRPWYFPQADEDIHAAVARECRNTRESLGVMDASTLGKIEVYGKDALTFLERMYTHDVGKLAVGRCAYGVMLGEDGMVMDDGVMARVGENHYYLTTTTGGAAGVYGWLERWLQTEWPELEVHLTSTTDHNATIALVGPNSRKLLQKLDSDIDYSADNFSFMSVKTGRLENIPVQVFRISFSGELAFEINLPADYALGLWKRLFEVGEEFKITPYGTESLHVLRAEKGFVIVGQDTDGSVTPVDLGMNWLLSKNKDYIGRRSLLRADCVRVDRKQLVGLYSVDKRTVLTEGAQLIEDVDAEVPVPLVGHVTSAYYSGAMEQPIAMALLSSGRKRHGERLYAVDHSGSRVPVMVTSPVFYDPKGDKQRV